MTISARTAAMAVLVGIGTAALSAVPASAVDRPWYCDDASFLPVTADAAEHWLDSCAVAEVGRTADADEAAAQAELDARTAAAADIRSSLKSAERTLAAR